MKLCSNLDRSPLSRGISVLAERGHAFIHLLGQIETPDVPELLLALSGEITKG